MNFKWNKIKNIFLFPILQKYARMHRHVMHFLLLVIYYQLKQTFSCGLRAITEQRKCKFFYSFKKHSE